MTKARKAKPPVEMAAARRTLAREIAAQLVSAMAFRDMSFDDIDARLANTHAPGWSQSYLYQLIDGRGNSSLDELSDFAFALNCRFTVAIEPKPEDPQKKVEPMDDGHEGI